MRFALIGAGRLGASLALALREAGAELAGFVCATDAGRIRAEGVLRMQPALGLDDLVATRPTHYILAVPDDVLPDVAAQLARLLPPVSDPRPPGGSGIHGAARTGGAAACGADGPFVMHTSGATSVSVLAECEQKGATTLAFHPLQTFSESVGGSKRFASSAVAVTPSPQAADTQSRDEGFAIAQALGARPFLLPDDRRALYHAAATVASNYLVALEHCADALFVLSGMPRDESLSLFLPLAQAALDNVRAQGPVPALTGPLSRGDENTISAHLTALEIHAPHLLPFYRQLGIQTLDLVRARGEVHPDVITRLAHLLGH
jgi:predicted short-subunit dehydrogenase-like oxidoreductase (DUF2520 family)